MRRAAVPVLRRLALAGAAAALSVASGLAGGGVARANGPSETGWWNQLDPAALAATPLGGAVAPPDVPPGGLYMANGAGGPMAIAALRIDVPARGTATLSLKAAASKGFAPPAAIDACPATSSWQSAANGAWESRPTYPSSAPPCVHGMAETDGSIMRWVLTSGLQPNGGHTYDVVLVPTGAVPFRVAVAPPGPETVTNFPAAASTDTAPAPVAAPAPAAAAPAPSIDEGLVGAGAAGQTVLASPAPSVGTQTSPATSLAPPVVRPQSSSAPAAAEAGTGQALSLAPAGSPLRPGDKRAQRILAVALLVALGSALFWFGGRPVRPPHLLGSLGGGGGGRPAVAPPVYGREVVGGVGRFARVRAAPPARL
ncbi:MAG: hypothetical protein ACYDAD_06105 [Acidimicrobiales bacterium]